MNSDKSFHTKRSVGRLAEFADKMRAEGIGEDVVEAFGYYYKKVVEKDKGYIRDRDIVPIGPDDVPSAGDLTEFAGSGRDATRKTAIITLNGGLGTSMGLTGPKSLIEIKDGKTFLDFKIEEARRRGVELVLMNSFNTHEKTLRALRKMEDRGLSDPPETFLQSKFPKIFQKNLAPATWEKDRSLEWNPPGHGEIYAALQRSGMLRKLLDRGIRYALVNNSDNLGARMDESLLGYFVEKKFPFMMEVTQRRPIDAKGGHLAYKKSGGLLLREIAQCPADELQAFQDIEKYRFFNTNNLWIDLVFLKDYMERHQNAVRLPMILKPGKLDPRDGESPDIFQVETAMGAAVSLFEGASAVNVPKDRFMPVKGHNDLLAICSDLYVVTKNKGLVMNPEREDLPPVDISLDPAYYRKFDMFSARFEHGPPSLLQCVSLKVKGDVFFEGNVVIRGTVQIENATDSQAVVKSGSVIDRDLSF